MKKTIVLVTLLLSSLSSFAAINVRDDIKEGVSNKELLLDCQLANGSHAALKTFEIGYHPKTKELLFVKIFEGNGIYTEVPSTMATLTLNDTEVIVEYSMPNSKPELFKMSFYFEEQVPNASIGNDKYFCD